MSPHNILNRTKSKFANDKITKKDADNNSFFGKFNSLEYSKNPFFLGKSFIDNNNSNNRTALDK